MTFHGKHCCKCNENPRDLKGSPYCKPCRSILQRGYYLKRKERLEEIKAELRSPHAIIARMKDARDRRAKSRRAGL